MKDYVRSGYDRGHQAPAGDFKHSEERMSDSFFLSNMAPQIGAGFNRDIWRFLEADIREAVDIRGQVFVVTGGIFYDPDEESEDTADGFIDYLTIGPNVRIFHRVVINCMGPVEIGSGAKLSQDTHLCAGTHAYQQTHMPIHPTPIKIGSDVWLAADVFIGPGVSIGDRAIIGARSSVFRDIPPNVIAYGDPAKPIRSRDEDRPTDE